MTGLADTLHISAAGMRAQGDRLRVVAENIANADAAPASANESPYRRKTLVFQSTLDRELNIPLVKVAKRGYDSSPFLQKYEPTHPAANGEGYVQYPNVNTIIEMMDMREARRGYEANLHVVEMSKSMLLQTISLLK